MFDYGTKSDAEGRRVKVQVLIGFAVLGVLVGTLGLLSSGLTAPALSNLLSGLSLGVFVLLRRKTHR
jgi:hypothetical protein